MRTRTTDCNRANISSVQTFFDKLLRGRLTKNLFFDELPTSIGKDWKELAVVNCRNIMRDKDAYARQTLLVMLYAKQSAYGTKDVRILQQLETKLNALIDENDDPYYHLSRSGCYSGYDAINDIYYTIVQINLIVT